MGRTFKREKSDKPRLKPLHKNREDEDLDLDLHDDSADGIDDYPSGTDNAETIHPKEQPR